MYKVLSNKKISENSYEMEVEVPLIVNKFIPGQFVIVKAFEDSERIPLTIYDWDKNKNTISLIYQVIGASTLELTTIKDEIYSVAGPLGNGNEICSNPKEFKDKRICYVAGGVGIAPVYPQVKFLNELGFKIDVIFGARNANLLIIREKVEKVVNKIRYATDDGSFGTKGLVTEILEKYIDDYDMVVTIGPVIMMKFVVDVCKKYNKPSIVSMNPLMIDGSGMCGACRCLVDGKVKFACIHGPEFPGDKVDFDLALKRMNIYKEEEKVKYDEMKKSLGLEV